MCLLNTSEITMDSFQMATSFCQVSNLRIICLYFLLALPQNRLSIIKPPRLCGVSVLVLLSGKSMQLGVPSCSQSKTQQGKDYTVRKYQSCVYTLQQIFSFGVFFCCCFVGVFLIIIFRYVPLSFMCSHKTFQNLEECRGWKSVRCIGLFQGLPTNEQIFIAHFMDRLKLDFGSNLTF